MKVRFVTLGCKTNQYETNAMEQRFIEKGYEITDEVADIYVINTCSVTNVAERKSRQALRRFKEKNPKAIIVATGCYVQIAKEEIEKIPEVDIVIGINEKNDIVELVEKNIKSKVTDVMHKEEYEDFGIVTYSELNRAVIKIQDGCDRFCTYCIIPYARGRVRSRKPLNILKEIEEISKKGIKEVVLTGIHIASYGKDFSEEEVKRYRSYYGYDDNYKKYDPKEDLSSGGFRFIELIEQINKIDTIERIRLGSIEPKLIDIDFVERITKLKKVCNHFHLSLQSGCNETLKRMNRRYTTEEFEKSVVLLRKNIPNVNITTDIIVGFPGETDGEFEKTYSFLSKIKLYKMHVFKYSPRKGTKAEIMQDQVDGLIKEYRSQKLIELSNKNQKDINNNFMGKEVDVLFEEKVDEYFVGHTSNYMTIKVKTEDDLENKICKVYIKKDKGLELIGELV